MRTMMKNIMPNEGDGSERDHEGQPPAGARLEEVGTPATMAPSTRRWSLPQHRLDDAGQVEAEDELPFGDGGDHVAFVQSARFIVDEEQAAADHAVMKMASDTEPGSRLLHVVDVGIDFDHVEQACGLAGRTWGALMEATRSAIWAPTVPATVRSVFVGNEREVGLVAFEQVAGIMLWNDEDAAEHTLAEVARRRPGRP